MKTLPDRLDVLARVSQPLSASTRMALIESLGVCRDPLFRMMDLAPFTVFELERLLSLAYNRNFIEELNHWRMPADRPADVVRILVDGVVQWEASQP